MMRRRVTIAGCVALLLTSACGDKQRCEADKSLAEVCADGHCPKDFRDAATRGRGCELGYLMIWRKGEQRAVGIAGESANIYYFQGQQLVGFEVSSDAVDPNAPCPGSWVNGEQSLLPGDEEIEECTPCSERQIYDLPRCTEAQLE